MSNEIFVDGICEIDDQTIRSYFSRFGSRIKNYKSHRHRPTNSCCFAVISFVSHHTVNAVLRQRPHLVNDYPLFVKRLLPSTTCSFTERLLPVSSILVYSKSHTEFDDNSLKFYFESFGYIVKFERDYLHNRLVVEYDDYDSVDRIFLSKEQLPYDIDIHKNVLPKAQNTIQYHGTCRRKQKPIVTNENSKDQYKKTRDYFDKEYQDLLQKTIENLINCKAQLKSKESDYMILQLEYMSIKEKADKLNQLLEDQNKTMNSCLRCKEHQLTIHRLKETIKSLNEEYEMIKSQYQQLISIQQKSPVTSNSISPRRHVLSTRLNNDRNFKNEVPEDCLSQSNRSTSGTFDIVMKKQKSSSPRIQLHMQQN